MKIGKNRLKQIISEEVSSYLKEYRGPFAAQMRRDALSQAYKDAPSMDQDDDEFEMQRQRDFRKSHMAQKQSGEGLPDWLTEEDLEEDLYLEYERELREIDDMFEEESDDDYDQEIDSLFNTPASIEEMEVDRLASIMENSVKSYLRNSGLEDADINDVMVKVDSDILDIAKTVLSIKRRLGEDLKESGYDEYEREREQYLQRRKEEEDRFNPTKFRTCHDCGERLPGEYGFGPPCTCNYRKK